MKRFIMCLFIFFVILIGHSIADEPDFTAKFSNNDEIVPGFNNKKDNVLKIRLEKVDGIKGCLILHLTGNINNQNSDFFQDRTAKVIDAGFIHLIFNFGDLNYLSDRGIGSLLSFLKTLKPKGGNLVLMKMQPKMYKVFQLTGFSQFFNIVDTREKAIDFFSQGEQTKERNVFPKIFECPICSNIVTATGSGEMGFMRCRTTLVINDSGQVFLK